MPKKEAAAKSLQDAGDNHILKRYGTERKPDALRVSFGKGKKGSPQDPESFATLSELADAIKKRASVKPMHHAIDSDEYKAQKDRGTWIMRAIDEATAYDEEKKTWHRRLGSVTECDWLMFDADKFPYGSAAKVRARLKADGVAFIMYTTTGHGLDCKGGMMHGECFRVLIPCLTVASEIAEAVSVAVRSELAHVYPDGTWDPATDQPTRVIYLPPTNGKIWTQEGRALDAAALFSGEGLTLTKSSASGLKRGEVDEGAFADFIDWCLDNVEDAVLIQKPDGRVALQMPGQQPEKYSDGADGGDGWNFYLPSGDYDMLVFHSLHANTEPQETFKVQDAVNILARVYGHKPAALYAEAVRDAQSKATPAVRSDSPEWVKEARKLSKEDNKKLLAKAGSAPRSVVDSIAVYEKPLAIEWPKDVRERPEEPAADASEEEKQAQLQRIEEWEKEYEQNRIDRFNYYARTYVLVAAGSLVADLSLAPSIEPLSLREWQIQQLPRYYFNGTTAKGEPKTHQYADAWLRSSKRQEVRDVGYAPGKSRIFERHGVPLLNTFYIPPFKYTEDESLLERFFWLVDRTHPIQKEADLFLDWLATKFRYPSFKAPFAHVNISRAFGTGRGSLIIAMKALFGSWNVESTSPKMILADQFHDYAYGKLITVIEEGDKDAEGQRLKMDGVLREMITADSKTLNLKYSGVKTDTPLYNSFAIFLNDYSLSINQGERRVQATTGAHEDTQAMTPEQNETLRNGFLQPAFRDQLASFLWRRDLSGYDAANPDKTLPAFEILCENGGSYEEQLAREICADLPCKVVPVAYIEARIQLALTKPENQGLNRQAVQRAIPAHRKKQKVRHGDKRIACHYFDPNMNSGFSEELRNGFSKEELDRYAK